MFPGLKRIIAIVMLATIMVFPTLYCCGADNAASAPYCIAVTFNGDVHSCRGFTWYTDEECSSDLLLAEANRSGVNGFSGARLYQGTSSRMQRYSGRNAIPKEVSMHRITLTDLKPDSSYIYKVGDARLGIWSEQGTFHTAARDDALSFIIVADSQGEDEQDFRQGAQTLNMAMTLMYEADFLVHMGDFVQSYSSENSRENFEEWQQFFATARKEVMSTTLLPVAGNHDMTQGVFAGHFALDKLMPAGIPADTGACYALNCENACFMVLNTNEGYQDGDGSISEEQVKWLESTSNLADKQGIKWKILLLHRGIYSFGRHMDSEDIIALRSQLAPVISELGIDLVLQGHDHVYMRSQVLAKSPNGDVAPVTEKIELVSQTYHGETVNFAINPPGTTYITPNLSGNQFGFKKRSHTVQVYPEAEYEPDNNHEPVFAGIIIDGNRLIYKAYAYNREGDGQVKEIDCYAILKDEQAGVGQQGIYEQQYLNTIAGIVETAVEIGLSGLMPAGWFLNRLYPYSR